MSTSLESAPPKRRGQEKYVLILKKKWWSISWSTCML